MPSPPATAVARTRAPRDGADRPYCSDTPDDLAAVLGDAAGHRGGHATRLCLPASEGEVAAVLAREPRVLCIGAQSSLTGGATPRGECVVSTARLAELTLHGSRSATVGAGVVLRTLLDRLAAAGLSYPPVPTWDGATLGGTVATNAAGAATFKYGSTRDWVRRAVFVLAGGEVLELHRGEVVAGPDDTFVLERRDGSRTRIRRPAIVMPEVAKISSGYWSKPGMDLLDLLIGSEGTLALVTEVEVALVARPRCLVALVPVATEEEALQLTAALRREGQRTRHERDPRGLDVAAIEYVDAASARLLHEDGIPARERVALPADAGALLLLQIEVPSGADDTVAGVLGALLAAHGALDATVVAAPDESRRQAALFALREAVPEAINRRILAAQRRFGPAIAKAAADVVVPFAELAGALHSYRAIAARHGLACFVWGHVSDGNVHPNLLPRDAEEAARAELALLEIGREAIARGGAPMSEHGVGRSRVKQQLLLDLYGPAGVASMRAVKRGFDPHGVLAPGVLFAAGEADVRR